ncbi:MAG: TetR family transcriptional regulator C-terminal domain-containing protein [Acidocella sp.]
MIRKQAPPPRPRQARSEQAVERILAAAERVFAKAGFGGATMTALAHAAGLPSANLHYHFGTKEDLYKAVLENILTLWLDATEYITPDTSPARGLSAYISAKLAYSRTRPYASKVFANEVLHGATHLHSYLGQELRRKVEEKTKVLEGWIQNGLMEPVDARHLFFLIWAMTQTYADFDTQIRTVLGRDELLAEDYATAERLILRLTLRGCGLSFPIPETKS